MESNSEHHQSKGRLPIYDQDSRVLTVTKTELPLQREVSELRKGLEGLRTFLDQNFDEVIGRGFEFERKISQNFSRLIDRDEVKSNSILWVGIGTMTGSIISRNRSLPIRFLSPLTLFLISSKKFLPNTTKNVREKVFELQDSHYPRSSILRDDLMRRFDRSVERFENLKDEFGGFGDRFFREGKVGFERISGLKVNHSGQKENHSSSESSDGVNRNDKTS